MHIVFLALVAFLSATPAQAGAVYEWVTHDTECCAGRLVISDAAYFAGGLQFEQQLPTSTDANPSDTLLEVFFTGDSGNSGFDWGPDWFDAGEIIIDLKVGASGLLSGGWFATTTGTTMSMAGSQFDWELLHYATDAPGPCAETDNDCGGLGYWSLVSAPGTPVSEPSAVLILLVGLGGLVAARRIRKRV